MRRIAELPLLARERKRSERRKRKSEYPCRNYHP
jgi:hypothetical protein